MLHKYYTNLLIISFFLCFSSMVKAQEEGKLILGKQNKVSVLQDSLPTDVAALADTLAPVLDSLPVQPTSQSDAAKISYSSDSLEAPVNYSAVDSMVYDLANQKIYLHGGAQVEYETMSLKADYIIFDIANDIVVASGGRDGTAEFVDGDQKFDSDSIKYNFRTHKGKVYQVRTEEGDGYLLSDNVKFDLRSQQAEGEDDVVYAQGTLYTTCNHPEPHFGVRSRKAKIIPDKIIVVGSSNLEIERVPTPLWLPFGFFPLKTGQRSGVIFPRNYDISPAKGVGLLGFGYYHVINDYWDIRATGDLYSRGSWLVNLNSTYRKRYKYNGSLTLSYSSQRLDIKEIEPKPIRDFNISWSHNQDASAHPTRTFSASVNLGTGSFYSNNYDDGNSVLAGTLSSNISVRKRFPGKPYSISAGFGHTQNTATRLMTVTFPEFNFNLNTIRPFERKNKIGKERWYEKITFGYTGRATGQAQTLDTLIFSNKDKYYDDIDFSITHDPTIGFNFKLFKYININPSVSYDERWFFKTQNLNFDPTNIINTDIVYSIDINGDTLLDALGNPLIDNISSDTIFGSIDTTTVWGFDALRQVSGGVSANTVLYGTLPLGKKGQAIRHVMKPNIGVTFSPNYFSDFWGYYDNIRTDNRDDIEDNMREYTRFITGAPRSRGGATLTYGIDNQLEAKFLNKKDSTSRYKKIMILNQLRFNSSYDFQADSLNMRAIRMGGNTKIFKVVDLRFDANFDPYTIDARGRRVNRYQWTENRRPARFTDGGFTLTTRLNPQDISKAFGKNKNEKGEAKPPSQQFVSSLSFNYSFDIRREFQNGKDTLVITTNTINLSGTTFNVTKKLRLQIGRIGYDFVRQSLTYPDISLSRDLHCWESGFSFRPDRRVFSFYLRAKPGSLDFLKIPYNRNRVDPFEF